MFVLIFSLAPALFESAMPKFPTQGIFYLSVTYFLLNCTGVGNVLCIISAPHARRLPVNGSAYVQTDCKAMVGAFLEPSAFEARWAFWRHSASIIKTSQERGN